MSNRSKRGSAQEPLERCPPSEGDHDLDIYALGESDVPFAAEVKARVNGAAFATLEKWLAGYDVLFLRRNRAKPLLLVPWRTWARILGEVRQ
jgi:hypothetical protein